MIDIKQLTQQKNELKQLWDYLGITTEFPDKQVRQWLLEFDVDEIGSAFQVLAKREDIVNDTVAYIGKVLRNAKLMNMTVEEREAKVSALRSLAGAIGARRKHEAEMKAIREGFARNLPQVCQNLPEVSQPFASEMGLEVEKVLGLGVEPVLEQEREQELKAATPPIAASRLASQAKEEKQKANPKPKPTPTPVTVSCSSANLEPKPTPKPEEALSAKLTPVLRKCPKCGEPRSRDKSHTCAEKALPCTCEVAFYGHGEHYGDCPHAKKARAASALGTVDEL